MEGSTQTDIADVKPLSIAESTLVQLKITTFSSNEIDCLEWPQRLPN